MIWTTSLEVSRTLKEMGVELDHEYGWYRSWRGLWTLGDMAEVLNNADQISNTTAPQWDYYPAYTLDQMHKVLEQVGKVKGWKEIEVVMSDYVDSHEFMGGQLTYSYEEGGVMKYVAPSFVFHYLRLCEAVPLSKGDEVLKEILK